jgi:MYXO-CTERM domain-containing protein
MLGMKLAWLAAPIALLSFSQVADAHLRLTSHEARYGDSQKQGPCGLTDGERTTDKVYIAKPGTQVMLTWDEFINHPSFYRIDFDLDGADLVNTVVACADKTSIEDCFDTTNVGPYMVNNIPDDPAAVQSYVFTLPDVECTNCTLQVIQAMHDKPPFETSPSNNDIYYQCIDIILDNNGPDVLTLVDGTAPDAGPGPIDDDAGAVTGADAGANARDAGGSEGGGAVDGSGCQTSGSSQTGGLWMLLLGALWWRRRNRSIA